MCAFLYDHGRCAAKVRWHLEQGVDFKQCTRKPKLGNHLCGIHLLSNPHGLVPGTGIEPPSSMEEATEMPAEAEVDEWDHLSNPGAGANEDDGEDEAEEPSDEQLNEHGSEDEQPEADNEHCSEDDHPETDKAEDDEQKEEPSYKKAKLEQSSPVKYLFNFEHISEHADLTQKCAKTAKHLEELERYSSFCTQMPDCAVPHHFKDLVETAVGPVSLEESMVQLYLTNLRFTGGPSSSKVHAVGHVQQLAKVWHHLVNGVKQSGLPHTSWPPWVCGHAAGVTQLFRSWKKVDAETEPAASKRTWVTSAQVEDYCVDIILKDMQKQSCYIELGEALLLRLQSSRSHRFVNLATLKWSDTGSKAASVAGENVPYINILCTKPLGSKSVQGMVQTKCKVELHITDAITNYLWSKWSDQPIPEGVAKIYVFPKQGKDNFLWDVPMPRAQHDKAVQNCAKVLQLAATSEQLYKYTSKSIRNGVAAEVSRAVRESLVGQNKKNGRSSNSQMDIATYAPAEVLVEPGALFGNKVAIQQKLEEAIANHFLPIKHNLLCAACGFPECDCESCKLKLEGQKSKVGHTCWLNGKKGPTPKSGPHETDDQLAARAHAWQCFGVDDVPLFQNGNYSW